MYHKTLRKIYAGCALAMALTIAAAPASAFAAGTNKEVNTLTPGTTDQEKTDKAAEQKKLTGIDPTAEDNPDTDGTYEGYVDTDIDVWGFTEDKTVYSVDVEWGAMTFEYEASSWDPVNHKKVAGAGWLVYDNASDTVIESAQDAINKVTVTNHSNASVYAKLNYTPEAAYSSTTGGFTVSADGAGTKATWNEASKYLTLQTAATDAAGSAVADGAEGTAAVGNVYFMPEGIADNQNISKWNKIGKITVAITTEAPTTTP